MKSFQTYRKVTKTVQRTPASSLTRFLIGNIFSSFAPSPSISVQYAFYWQYTPSPLNTLVYILLKQGHSLYNQHTQCNQEISIDSTIPPNLRPHLNFTNYLNNVSFSFLGHNSILEHMLHLVVISYNFLQSGAVPFPVLGCIL